MGGAATKIAASTQSLLIMQIRNTYVYPSFDEIDI